MPRYRFALLVSLIAVVGAIPAFAQPGGDPGALMSAQKEALTKLDFMDGVWRGTAWTVTPSGEKHTITQTERVGSFLGGAVKVIEGRGYEGDDRVVFNALAIISFEPSENAYSMRSYALGHAGDFPVTLTDDGYTWEVPARASTLRYTAMLEDGRWEEIGERIVEGQKPIRFFEMNLKRVGDTDWPAGGAVSPR